MSRTTISIVFTRGYEPSRAWLFFFLWPFYGFLFFIDGQYDPCFILPNVFSASRCPAEGHVVMAIVKNLSLNDHPDDKLVWARRATFFSSTVQNVRRDCQSVPEPLQCLLFSRLVRYWVQWLFDLLFLGFQNRNNDRILKLL